MLKLETKKARERNKRNARYLITKTAKSLKRVYNYSPATAGRKGEKIVGMPDIGDRAAKGVHVNDKHLVRSNNGSSFVGVCAEWAKRWKDKGNEAESQRNKSKAIITHARVLEEIRAIKPKLVA